MNDTDSTPPSIDDEQIPSSSAPSTPVGPQPLLESEARTWAMLVHIIAAVAVFISGGLLGFVAPLVVWLIFRQRSALVDYSGKQNINLQLTYLVVAAAAVIVGVITFMFGFILTLPLWFAYGIYVLVISIVAGLKANNGEYYRIRMTIPFIR